MSEVLLVIPSGVLDLRGEAFWPPENSEKAPDVGLWAPQRLSKAAASSWTGTVDTADLRGLRRPAPAPELPADPGLEWSASW